MNAASSPGTSARAMRSKFRGFGELANHLAQHRPARMAGDGTVANQAAVALALHDAERFKTRHLVLQRAAGHARRTLQSAEVERLAGMKDEVDDDGRQRS